MIAGSSKLQVNYFVHGHVHVYVHVAVHECNSNDYVTFNELFNGMHTIVSDTSTCTCTYAHMHILIAHTLKHTHTECKVPVQL